MTDLDRSNRERNDAEQSWWNAARIASKWLVQDLRPSAASNPVFCYTDEQRRSLWELSHTLMAKPYDGSERFTRCRDIDEKWLQAWRTAVANTNDRRQVIALLGTARARGDEETRTVSTPLNPVASQSGSG